MLEHVRSPLLPIRAVERFLVTVRFQGDHMVREPLDQLRAKGFAIDRLEHSKLGIVERIAAHKQ